MGPAYLAHYLDQTTDVRCQCLMLMFDTDL